MVNSHALVSKELFLDLDFILLISEIIFFFSIKFGKTILLN